MAEAESGQPLSTIVEEIRTQLTGINGLRDATLNRSRALIRACAESIRAIHRHEWEEATSMLAAARAAANEMVDALVDNPMLYHAGYTQDALKELVEAHLLFAVVRGGPMPQPAALRVTGPTYLRGMSEAATEMRRFILDLMRQGHIVEAEPPIRSPMGCAAIPMCCAQSWSAHAATSPSPFARSKCASPCAVWRRAWEPTSARSMSRRSKMEPRVNGIKINGT
jgi:predicted translin family RNA/ssDNA-binding protein